MKIDDDEFNRFDRWLVCVLGLLIAVVYCRQRMSSTVYLSPAEVADLSRKELQAWCKRVKPPLKANAKVIRFDVDLILIWRVRPLIDRCVWPVWLW